MKTDRCVELQFTKQQTRKQFNSSLESLCQQLDGQVNYVIEVDDSKRKAYVNLDATRSSNTLTLGHVCGVIAHKILGQDREVFCQCGSNACANAMPVEVKQ